MKKRILFMAINMNVGGTEKALLNMISEIPQEQYEITLLLLEKYGGFLNQIPGYVKVNYLKDYKEIKKVLNYPLPHIAIDSFKQRNFVNMAKFLCLYGIRKLFKSQFFFYRLITKNLVQEDAIYDMAIAYAGPMDFITYYVLNKIKAKQKIQWIHFDVTKIGLNRYFVEKAYKKFDKIYTVSHEGRLKLISLLPSLTNITETFLNIISPETVRRMAKTGYGFNDDFEGVRILTVGRLSKEKGQDLAIKTLYRLKEAGYKIRWYCIGDGPAKEEYEALIRERGLEKDFVLLGTKINPYPYMKQCDLYVQTSRHEGYCITLTEARCFNNPIITTNFTGASEQIKDKVTGLIIPFREDKLEQAIKKLIIDKDFYNVIQKNLKEDQIGKLNNLENLFKMMVNDNMCSNEIYCRAREGYR